MLLQGIKKKLLERIFFSIVTVKVNEVYKIYLYNYNMYLWLDFTIFKERIYERIICKVTTDDELLEKKVLNWIVTSVSSDSWKKLEILVKLCWNLRWNLLDVTRIRNVWYYFYSK